MEIPYPVDWPCFYTATIYEWQHVLAYEQCKKLSIKSLQFLVDENRIILYGFVIMSNHIHLIWQPKAGHNLAAVQHAFMK